MQIITNEAYQLFHEGCVALSQVETNGMKVDEDYLHKAIENTSTKIKILTNKLKDKEIYRVWKRTYGDRMNIDSPQQLGKVLFDVMGYPCSKYTGKSRQAATDEETLKATGLKFVSKYLKIKKLKKARSTYLRGILRESINGFINPSYNLNLPQSMRSSCDHPNFQNFPIRNPDISELVRSAFISRWKKGQICETDYGGAEICGATCYHQDPNMIDYIINSKRDLHRDMAGDCYILRKKEVNKMARYCGKNMFVFPQFYGDWYLSCAKSLWEAIEKFGLTNPTTGESLYRHLKKQGIRELGECDSKHKPKRGTFEYHIQQVEKHFWHKRFKVYDQWKRDWWDDYLEKGYFDMLTGFRIEGVLERKKVINYPIQGTAFHWLLWSLIQIQKRLNKYKMKSKIVGQIHDSIVADIFKGELKAYLEICKEIMTEKIRKHWKWIVVPLTIEAEAASAGRSWFEKKEVKI